MKHKEEEKSLALPISGGPNDPIIVHLVFSWRQINLMYQASRHTKANSQQIMFLITKYEKETVLSKAPEIFKVWHFMDTL